MTISKILSHHYHHEQSQICLWWEYNIEEDIDMNCFVFRIHVMEYFLFNSLTKVSFINTWWINSTYSITINNKSIIFQPSIFNRLSYGRLHINIQYWYYIFQLQLFKSMTNYPIMIIIWNLNQPIWGRKACYVKLLFITFSSTIGTTSINAVRQSSHHTPWRHLFLPELLCYPQE